MHWTNPSITPDLAAAMLLASLILLGFSIIFKPHRMHAFISNILQPRNEPPSSYTPQPSKPQPNNIPQQPRYRPDPTKPLQVNVENAIRNFKPGKRWQYERQYQDELYDWLKRDFPYIVEYEIQTGSSRPDLVIKDIAIEIKGPTGNRELDTLTTKFLKYSNYYPNFIIVLFDCNFTEGHYNDIYNGIRKHCPNVRIIRK
jgi:hypothetical protein